MSSTHATSRYLSTKQAAEYLGVHRHTIHNWVTKGKIIAHRDPGGRILRFDPAELDAAYSVVPADDLAEHAQRVVEDFPPLTDAQIERIASLLRTGGAS